GVFGDGDESEDEPVGGVLGLADLAGLYGDGVGSFDAAFHFDEVQVAGGRVSRFDVVTGLVMGHRFGLPSETAFCGQDGGDGSPVDFFDVLGVGMGGFGSGAGEPFEESLGDDDGAADDGGRLVGQVEFLVELSHASVEAGLQVVGDFAGVARGETAFGFFALEFFGFGISSSGVPVVDLGGEAFFDGCPDPGYPLLGDPLDLLVVGAGEVGDGVGAGGGRQGGCDPVFPGQTGDQPVFVVADGSIVEVRSVAGVGRLAVGRYLYELESARHGASSAVVAGSSVLHGMF